MHKFASLAALAAALPAVPAVAQEASDHRAAARSEAEDVVVTGQLANRTEVTQGGQLGVLGSKDGLDVPFSIRSYGSALILNQQSETLGEVLQNDPTVRTTLGYGNFSEQFVIRGFTLYGDDISIDGLYGVTPRQLVSPELYDSVQVLNGANAFLNGVTPGSSGIGGGVNLLFKRAGDAPLTRLVGQYRGQGIGGGALDVSRRYGSRGQFGARLNVAGHSGESAVDGEHRDDVTVGGSFDFRTDRLRVAVDLGYQRYHVQNGRSAVLLAGTVTSVPRVPGASANYSQPWSFTTLRDFFGVVDAEYDLADHVTLYAKGGARDGSEVGDYSSVTVTNGTTGAATGGRLYVPRNDNNESVTGGVRAAVQTGGLGHEINLGLSGEWNAGRYGYALGTFPVGVRGSSAYNYATNLYSQVQVAKPADAFPANLALAYPINRTLLKSVFLSDTLSALDGRVLLTAGLRHQNIAVTGYAYATGAASSYYDKSATTPVVGLVVKPAGGVSLYFNRVEGLAQGGTAPTNTTNAGQIFAPYKSTQYEIGGKYEVAHASASLALFTTEQPNAYTAVLAGNAIGTYVQDGRQRNRGIEFTATAEPSRGLRLIGGATVIDAKLRRTASGTFDGRNAIGVPNYTINGNVEYDLPFVEGLTLTGRIVQTGEQKVNLANTLVLPSWTRGDIGGRYVFPVADRPVTLRVGIDNIANNRYWASSLGGYLVQGGARTGKVSLAIDL